MIDGAGLSKGYVAEVSWCKSITRFFNMQAVLKIIDINQWCTKRNKIVIRQKFIFNCLIIIRKENHRRYGILINLDSSHCQPFYETNKAIRSHPFPGIVYLLYRAFAEPDSQWQF